MLEKVLNCFMTYLSQTKRASIQIVEDKQNRVGEDVATKVK